MTLGTLLPGGRDRCCGRVGSRRDHCRERTSFLSENMAVQVADEKRI